MDFVKINVLLVVLVFLSASFSFAQTSESSCALINNARDSFFIEFERIEDKQNDGGKKRKNIILRLKNNSTCSIQLTSADLEHFRVKENFPPNTSAQQKIEQIKNPKWREINNDEFIPRFEFVTELTVYNSLYVQRLSDASDITFSFSLKGGNSILFAVPFKNFEKKLLVLVPFEFKWETNRAKDSFGGDTHHLIWFSYSNLPDEIKQKLRVK